MDSRTKLNLCFWIFNKAPHVYSIKAIDLKAYYQIYASTFFILPVLPVNLQ